MVKEATSVPPSKYMLKASSHLAQFYSTFMALLKCGERIFCQFFAKKSFFQKAATSKICNVEMIHKNDAKFQLYANF